MKIKSLSKQKASKYRPTNNCLMISIQDGEKEYLPFKERTNHITRNRYKDILFLYFDDLNSKDLEKDPYNSFAFKDYHAEQIISFLKRHYHAQDFDEIIIHCQAGVSRSHAVALFTAKYFEKNDELFNKLLHQENKIFGGNDHIYNTLIKNL